VCQGGATAVVVLALTGCGGQGNAEAGNVEVTAVEFSRSVGDAPARACELLAPKTLEELESSVGPCPSSLGDEAPGGAGPAAAVEVYGKDALVRLPTDTVFLARFPQGWRVTAAGCTKVADGRPYDCAVKGG
jgi:hypothetical protein